MRQGSRAARSPPGRRSGRRRPRRWNCPPATSSSSPPQASPSLPRPTPSSARPSTGRVSKRTCSASTAPTWAWWCCTPIAGTPRRAAVASATRVEWKSGCRSWATARTGPAARASRASTAGSTPAQASALSRSPRLGPKVQPCASSRQAACLNQAPRARMGRACACSLRAGRFIFARGTCGWFRGGFRARRAIGPALRHWWPRSGSPAGADSPAARSRLRAPRRSSGRAAGRSC